MASFEQTLTKLVTGSQGHFLITLRFNSDWQSAHMFKFKSDKDGDIL